MGIPVFEGNTADPTAVGEQTRKIQRHFGIVRVALAGDGQVDYGADSTGSGAGRVGLGLSAQDRSPAQSGCGVR